MKVLILGYFDRQNLGDDMFEFVFHHFFERYNALKGIRPVEVLYRNTDDINQIPADTDLIICGGGDLINDYFLNKIKCLTENFTGPIYAWGVGLPYPQLIEKGVMDIFDYIIHRNYLDSQKLIDHYGCDRVFHAPDLAFLLLKQYPIFPFTNKGPATNYKKLPIWTASYQSLKRETRLFGLKTSPKKIGVFLARPIYRPEDPEAYEKIKYDLSRILVSLAEQKVPHRLRTCFSDRIPEAPKYELYLVPSCTHVSGHQKEDDRILNQELFDLIKARFGDYPNIHLIEDRMLPAEVLPIFSQFDYTICTRFHAHVFSVLTKTPFLSISSSRKVETFLAEIGLKSSHYQMPVNPIYLNPTSVDVKTILQLWNSLTTRDIEMEFRGRLAEIVGEYSSKISHLEQRLQNLLFYRFQYKGVQSPRFVDRVDIQARSLGQKLYEFIHIQMGLPVPTIDDVTLNDFVTQRGAIGQLVANYDDCSLSAQSLTQLVSFYLIGQRESCFSYGLQEQILTPNYQIWESVEWILGHHLAHHPLQEKLLQNKVAFAHRKLDMFSLDHLGLEGFHRAGWPFVIEHMVCLHNPDGPIFDSYLDKTFGWHYDFYANAGYLPIQKEWLGVFHHTPDENYSINNLVEIFKKPLFVESLSTCQGIIVLSEYLSDWVKQHLNQLGIENIPVLKLYHPTEIVSNVFTLEKFKNNDDKKLVQVGAWLRNSYAIYALPAPKKLRKCALRGKGMENYYPKEDYLPKIQEALYRIGCSDYDQLSAGQESDRCCHQAPICRPEAFCNKYLVGLNHLIEMNHESVEIIDKLSNDEYDQLLTKNVVFIHLSDASAVNTIIECIVRHTPILVNRLLAVEEYLGTEYPLYYSSFCEAYDLINDEKKIKEAYCYLRRLDQSRFHIYHYLQRLVGSCLYRRIEIMPAKEYLDFIQLGNETDNDPELELPIESSKSKSCKHRRHRRKH